MTFYIIDEHIEIIDESDNMLALRLVCADMNALLGGSCRVVSKEEYEVLFNEIVIGE